MRPEFLAPRSVLEFLAEEWIFGGSNTLAPESRMSYCQRFGSPASLVRNWHDGCDAWTVTGRRQCDASPPISTTRDYASQCQRRRLDGQALFFVFDAKGRI
jgi:hypothetical protein